MQIRWRRIVPIYVIGFAVAAICELGSLPIPLVDEIVTPGVLVGFVTMLLFRTSFFDHPRIFAAIAVTFNGLLYGFVFWAATALSRRALGYNRS